MYITYIECNAALDRTRQCSHWSTTSPYFTKRDHEIVKSHQISKSNSVIRTSRNDFTLSSEYVPTVSNLSLLIVWYQQLRIGMYHALTVMEERYERRTVRVVHSTKGSVIIAKSNKQNNMSSQTLHQSIIEACSFKYLL